LPGGKQRLGARCGAQSFCFHAGFYGKLEPAEADHRIRTGLAHITAAERWWFGNWKEGPTTFFPDKETSISIDELVKEHESVAAARDAFIARLSDDDLSRRVDAQPRKDVLASFPLGQTMVQLCCHGTYHRAQALNMLRHAGAEPMRMDYLVMCKEKSLRA